MASILPSGSFSSVSPFGEEEQRDWAASYHGFKGRSDRWERGYGGVLIDVGRWRDADPAVKEFERLKKIKEEEDKEKTSSARG